MKLEEIASFAHEANAFYCHLIGDDSQTSWSAATQWQKDSAIAGAQFHLDNPDAGPEASHAAWMARKLEDGWKFGAEKNPDIKEHPCLVPFDQLPVEQQRKDYLFIAIVKALAQGGVT